MSLASPIWRKFIHSPFGRLGHARREFELSGDYPTSKKEADAYSNVHEVDIEEPGMNSESDEEEELDFQDDDSEALLLLLRIAHVQFVGIPKTLPYETLFPVAVLVDQYECAELIQPWVQNWLANEKSKSLELGKSKWLFIVWALGREAVLHELAGKCVNEVMHYGDQPNASSYDILKTNKFLKSPSPPLLID